VSQTSALTNGPVLDAGEITLVDLYSPVDRYCLFASLMFPTSLQQVFTSTRPVAADSYRQDLGEFLIIWKDRKTWLKQNHVHSIQEYIASPAGSGIGSQFCLVISFQYDADASKYRKHFNP
jgi:hypothetical protein